MDMMLPFLVGFTLFRESRGRFCDLAGIRAKLFRDLEDLTLLGRTLIGPERLLRLLVAGETKLFVSYAVPSALMTSSSIQSLLGFSFFSTDVVLRTVGRKSSSTAWVRMLSAVFS